MYRQRDGHVEVLLAHPGGPYWASLDEGAWTIPKGGLHDGESALEAAMREFEEETGFTPHGPYVSLGHIVQRSGKTVYAWAFEGDCDPSALTSVMTTTDWPPKSGQHIEVPEIDRAEFFKIAEAKRVANVAQAELFDRLLEALGL